MRILRTKYQILWSEYRRTNDVMILEAAAQTSELIIEILEKIRLSIGEEGSRLLLGDKYRNSYMDAIKCLNECYRKTNNQQYLDKAFECSEKSKVASLLASTREIKAIQNNIPPALANKEKELQWNIGFYSSALADEENNEKPDSEKVRLWKDQIRVSAERRDSLIKFFEINYPDYYSIKYNSNVIGLNEIPGIIGKRKNYLSYIVSDSLLYTFISNRKYRLLIIQKIDPSFIEMVTGFRKILSTPDMDEKSFDEFKIFQDYGYKLYSFLIEPVKKYLVSNNLIISPDDILSYLPFETFLTGESISDDLIYRKLPYLMDDYNISYAYSATLLAENEKVSPSLRNKAIVFSPSYETPIDLDSISIERQSNNRILRSLPNAREEAEYVSGITHGILYTDTSATESNYKKMAGSFDIIHLAMHTYIDMQNPILSRLFFSGLNSNSALNGMSAFEIYGISIRAKMVVLSSCNTGVGNLRRGEGILSLARGFIYSGSKSVVMSLWEVDDKSGTDIVKSFYRYLKNGYSKGEALRNARIKYLKNAGTLRSFPYFWSTLVIYGDDSPVYYTPMTKFIVVFTTLILILGTLIYFRKR
jgi:CHAT domain-containing protein